MGILFEFIVAIILVAGLGQTGTIPNIGLNITTALLLLLLTVMVRIALNVIYLPAKIYKDQGGFESNRLKLVVKPDCPKPNVNEDGWLTLRIYNRSKEDIQECYVKLERVTKTEDRNYIVDPPVRLRWSSEDPPREERKSLVAGSDRKVDIAIAIQQRDEIGFQVQNGSQYYTNAGHFHAVLMIYGSYQKAAFIRQLNLDFAYEGGAKFICDKNGVEIELVEENRTPLPNFGG